MLSFPIVLRTTASVFLLLSAVVQAQTSQLQGLQEQVIRWEVKHRFPLFRSEDALRNRLQITQGQSLQQWSLEVLSRDSYLLQNFVKAYHQGEGKGCKKDIASTEFPTLWNPCTESYDEKLFQKGNYEILVELAAPPSGLCKFRTDFEEKIVICGSKLMLKIPSPNIPYLLSVEQLNGDFRASTNVQIRDILLVAFGDSFSSGESNPDVPARHEDPLLALSETQYHDGISWLKAPQRPAAWLDSRCHRSLFSWPVLAAARLASEDPHLVVRIASWACSGAEITDGFYSPQLRSGPLQKSQFMAARTAICKKKEGSGKPFDTVERLGKGNGNRTGKLGAKVAGCVASDQKYPIDAALFTFGGNDVFFAPILADAVMATGFKKFGILNPIYKPLRKGNVKKVWDAKRRIDGNAFTYDNLHVRYNHLSMGLNALGIPPERVFQIQYPNPLRDADQQLCAESHYDGMDVLDYRQGRTNLTYGESYEAELKVVIPLINAIKVNGITQNVGGRGWQIVDEHVAEMADHGLCAFRTDRKKEFAMPRLTEGKWDYEFKPSDYRHYNDTARWFRTPDDVAMGMFEGSKFLPIQGAFHPSAHAHAVIGDKVYEALRKTVASKTTP
ncbi:MAG: hypothetical protein QE279_07110 [Rhodoferax sp.]|nr:hypothetical protein [Rhodoferax sp.]